MLAIYTKHSGFGIMPSHQLPGFRNQSPHDAREITRNEMKLALKLALLSFALVAFVAHVTSEAAAPNQSGAELYTKHCASCHGKDGRAKTFKAKFNHARDLTDPLWQDEVSDEGLFNSIMNGKKKMPAYRKKLSEAQVNSLIAYIRTFGR